MTEEMQQQPSTDKDDHEDLQHHRHKTPRNFLCPLTLEVMREPLMDHCGHSFDKGAILEWIDDPQEGNSICPISRKPLKSSDLVPNDTLKKTIQQWTEQHNNHRRTVRGVPLKAQKEDIQSKSSEKTTSSSDETELNSNIQNDPHTEAGVDVDTDADESLSSSELGHAISSLSTVLASKEGYVELNSEDSYQEPNFDPEDDLDLEQQPPQEDSLRYTMFLPQEREAIARVRQRARDRLDAERLAFLVKAGIGLSVVLLCLVLLFFLAKLMGDSHSHAALSDQDEPEKAAPPLLWLFWWFEK